MSPVCSHCGDWIDADNRRHPGYCSPPCARYSARDIAAANKGRKARRLHNRQRSHGIRTETVVARSLDDNIARGLR